MFAIFTVFAVVADTSDNDSDKKNNSKSYYEDEPERTDDDTLFDGGDGVVEIDSLGDIENAEGREVLYAVVEVADGFGEDDFLEFAGLVGMFGLFVVGIDDFAGENVCDVNEDEGVTVGVAAIFNSGGKGEVGIKREGGDGVFKDFAIADGVASDVGINNTGEDEDIVDVEVGVFGGSRIFGDNDGGVLTASGNVVGDVDSVIDVLVFVGLKGASRVVDSNPVDDFGIAVGVGKCFGIAENAIRFDRNDIGETFASVVGDGNGDGARVSAASF